MGELRGIRSLIPTIGLLGLGTLLYVGVARASLWSFRSSWFASLNPGASPPWYFIGQDLIGGIWHLGGLLAFCFVAWVSARHLGPVVWSVSAVSLIWFLPKIGLGLNAWRHTENEFSRSAAHTTWATFDAYMRSQERAAAVWLGVAMALSTAAIVMYGRALKRTKASMA